jgi:glycosyltransferase involved in cell wall biosynthesis
MGIRNISESIQVEINKYLSSLMNKKERPIQIGYIGRFAPGGYTKGIEDLINYAKFSQAMNLNNEITLIGAIESEIEDYNSLRISLGINSKYLKIKPHVSHSIAVRMMRSFDVLILPKYSSESYMGMPLKLLEYLSSGRITIIADIDLYTKFFTSSFKPFLYTPEDMLSLDYSLNSALKDKKLRAKLNAGVNFASNFTWQKRTSKILKSYGI